MNIRIFTLVLFFIILYNPFIYSQNGVIKRANLDGSSIENVVENLASPARVELDIANSKIYWGERGTSKKIKRANLDATGIETIVDNGQLPRDIKIDFSESKLYWIEDSDNMRKSDLNGSNIEIVTTEFASSSDFGMDEANSKIYVGDSGFDNIRRFDQDGSNIEELGFAQTPRGLDLDLTNGKIYWLDGFLVKRSDLDGSNNETIISTSDNLGDIALDVPNNKMYYSNISLDIILKADLDGSNIVTIISGIDDGPGGIELDLTNNKIYWTQNNNGPLSVDLSFFEAIPNETKNQVDLNWKTETEHNNTGFEVQKSIDAEYWETLGFVEGNGSTDFSNEYTFLDRLPFPGSNYYRLKQIDFDGQFEFSSIEYVNFESDRSQIMSIYPNPSRGYFTIYIENPDQQSASIKLFDSAGLLIWEKRFDNGEMEVSWFKLFDLPQQEVYFLTVQIGEQLEVQKVIMIDDF